MAISLKKKTEENTETAPPLRDDSIKETNFRQPGGNGSAANTPPSPRRFQHGMGFQESVTACFKKYDIFTGRATRAEYWWFQLFIFAGLTVLAALIVFPANKTIKSLSAYLWLLFSITVILPNLAVSVRRLHDIDCPGWWLLVTVFAATQIPIICLIA